MKKIKFIINPHSGSQKNKNWEKIIKENLDTRIYTFDIEYTEYAKHAPIIVHQAINEKYYAVVAVGGDGTVHEVASAAIAHDIVVGIIPQGSGNGIAHHLGYKNIITAFEIINKDEPTYIDHIQANEEKVIGFMGIGFDAHIAHQFQNRKNRGLKGYIVEIIKSLQSYKNKKYTIQVQNSSYTIEAFICTITNTNEYGNHCKIAPQARYNDGIMEISSWKKDSVWNTLSFAFQLFTNKANKNKNITIFSNDKAIITTTNNIKQLSIHIDGEPLFINTPIDLHVIKNQLSVFI